MDFICSRFGVLGKTDAKKVWQKRRDKEGCEPD